MLFTKGEGYVTGEGINVWQRPHLKWSGTGEKEARGVPIVVMLV